MTSIDASQLEEAFEFNTEELSLNRSGTLSDRQKKLLEDTRKLRGCGRRAATLALGGTGALFAVFFAYLLISGQLNSAGAIIAYSAILAIFAGLTLLSFMMDYMRGRDLSSGHITVLEGQASKHQVKEKKSAGELNMKWTEYYVRVGGRRLRLQTPEQLDALRSEAAFRLYIIKNPPVDIVLSVEAV